jgi:hypothetical protein
MAEPPAPTSRRVRIGFAVLGLASAGVAIGAAVSHVWLTAFGTSLTALGMAIFFWSTRPHRAG